MAACDDYTNKVKDRLELWLGNTSAVDNTRKQETCDVLTSLCDHQCLLDTMHTLSCFTSAEGKVELKPQERKDFTKNQHPVKDSKLGTAAEVPDSTVRVKTEPDFEDSPKNQILGDTGTSSQQGAVQSPRITSSQQQSK